MNSSITFVRAIKMGWIGTATTGTTRKILYRRSYCCFINNNNNNNEISRPTKYFCSSSRMLLSSTTTSPSSDLSSNNDSIKNVLQQVQDGTMTIPNAMSILSEQQKQHRSVPVDTSSSSSSSSTSTSDSIISSFANIDHDRFQRTKFPEVVFAQNKKPKEIKRILYEMAKQQLNKYKIYLKNKKQQQQQQQDGQHQEQLSDESVEFICQKTENGKVLLPPSIASRVSIEKYAKMTGIGVDFDGTSILEYHGESEILTLHVVVPEDENKLLEYDNDNDNDLDDDDDDNDDDEMVEKKEEQKLDASNRVVVVTAGTSDGRIAEEVKVLLQQLSSGNFKIEVDTIYDVGVAGLHRIINVIPRLTHPSVKCIIVIAGMDGALPSVVGGLVQVPVIAVPTSIGYGAAFHGISPLLTMLNSCSPGVAVVNIDNGFGAAAFACKMIRNSVK